ncbi:MAG: PhzF family phenazine biosynthesis protein [Rubrivivax sp.]|nr:PhzF family phenazine biosynthesis protein [Rubrivivax sp.]
MNRPFQQVDVFTDRPYFGNPVAVVLDGQGLDTAQMHRFTEWTNLSEATFVLPPEDPQADYRLRIFCPGRELPFAGHPTLGSCHAWLAAGGQAKGDFIVQECGVGPVRIRRDGQRLAFAAPPLRRNGALDDIELDRILRGLQLNATDVLASAWCDNGPGWRALLLRNVDRLLALKPDATLLKGLDVGLAALHPAGGENQLEVRAFFPGNGGTVVEDPVTGSLNAALAQWLIGSGRLPSSYVAAQGTAMGRAGRVFVQQQGSDIWIGGHSVSCISGQVEL